MIDKDASFYVGDAAGRNLAKGAVLPGFLLWGDQTYPKNNKGEGIQTEGLMKASLYN